MKIKIVSCTMSDSKTYEQLPIMQSYNKLKQIGDIDIEIFLNNKLGMSERYNTAIEKHKNDCDVMIFAHDDLYISDLFLFEKLEKAMQRFDIVGVAGTNNFSIKNLPRKELPISWVNSDHKGWSGFVEHPLENKNPEAESYMNVFGTVPKEVVTMDGLFIACNTKIFKNEKIKFDTQFTFDFYDLDFCINAYLNKCRLGIEGIYVKHLSRGEGMLTEKYKETEKTFLQKWQK